MGKLATLTILDLGGTPNKIGTTEVNLNKHTIGFRCSYPDDSGRDVSKTFNDYTSCRKWYDENKEEEGDIHMFVCLLSKEDECLDEELIDSFWDNETGM